MKQILSIPLSAAQVIHEYTHLPLGGKEVVCPYHINIQKERVGLRVLVGKGDPGEIIREVQVWAKLKDFDIDKASESQIREFMINHSIGIECSGFVSHVLGFWLKSEHKKNLQDYLVFPNNGIINILRRLLRPLENINADTLTSLANCDPINELNEVLPGDLLRSKGRIKNSFHVSLISKVIKENDNVVEIEYIHSQRYYDEENGVKTGKILVNDPSKPLEQQHWLEIKNGRNYTYEGYLRELEDNGIRRLKRVKLHHLTTKE